MPFSLFFTQNWIKVCFLLISIKSTISLEFNQNDTKQLNDVIDGCYSLKNLIEEKSKDEEDSRSILDNLSYNEFIELNARVNEDTDHIILYRSPETLNYIDIFVNNELITDAIDDYDNTTHKYKINFNNVIPANSNISIKFYFQNLSLSTLKTLFLLDAIRVTDDDNANLEANMKISLSTYILAAFMAQVTVTKYLDDTIESWEFKYNFNDILDESLLRIVYEADRFFQKLFLEKYRLPGISPFYSMESLINLTNFTQVKVLSIKTLKDTPRIVDKEKEQKFISNLYHEWAYMYFNSMKLNLEESKWIIEGLVTYLEYYGIFQYKPMTKIHRAFVEEHLLPALKPNSLNPLDSITSMSWNKNSNILEHQKKMINSKLGSVFRMLHLTFGLPVLSHAIHHFYQRGKHLKPITLDELERILQDEIFFIGNINLQLDISTVIESWVRQPGYPLLTVTMNGCDVSLHQSKFMWTNDDSNDSVNPISDSVWWIPITWITKKTVNLESTAPVYWFNTTHDQIMIPNELKNDWIVFNSAKTGFYRVNYDNDSWRRILKILNSDSISDIPVVDRMAIIDDIIVLAKTSHISIDIYLKGLEYTRKETYSGPLKILSDEFINLHEYFSDTKDFEDVDEFIFDILHWAYDALGPTKKVTDDISLIPLRTDLNILMDSIKLNKCVRSIYNYWENIGTKTKILEKSYKYCSSTDESLKAIDIINFNKLSFLSAVKQPFSQPFSFCFKVFNHKDSLLNQLQEETSDELSLEEITMIMKEMCKCRNQSVQIVLSYLIQHPKLINYYCIENPSLFLDLISSFSQYLIKPTDLLYELEKSVNTMFPQCLQVKQLLITIRKNKEFENEFYAKNHASIVQWMKKNNNDFKMFEEISYLLRNDILPIHYIIELTPYMGPVKFYFDGRVKITAKVVQRTSKLQIHFYKLAYKSIHLTADGQKVAITEVNLSEKYQYLDIQISGTLPAHSILTIEILYTGEINQEKRGLYRDFYINDVNELKWFATTDLQRASARRMFPCFDEPSLKAIFQLSINRTANFRTVSNTKLLSTMKQYDRYLDIFETTPEISTHQIAFILSEFNSSDQVSNSFSWANNTYVLELIYPVIQNKDFFTSLENLVNPIEPNNYTYYDELAQMRTQLENYGHIIYKQKNVIANPKYVSLLDRLTYVVNWTYEMMYRFFRNYLFMNFWRCEWFNRAISFHFLSVGYEDDKNFKSEGNTLFVVHHLQPAMLTDASLLGGSFIFEDYNTEQINNAYNQFTDDKGASILRMIENSSNYTDTVYFFQQFVLNVVNNKNLYSYYVPKWGDCPAINQFCSMLEINKSAYAPNSQSIYSNCILKPWIIQKGFPVVHVKIDNNTAIISQKPFQYNNFLKKTNSQYLWKIPITWTTSNNPDFLNTRRHFLLQKHEASFKIDGINDDDWVIFNLQQIGYYRVNYDFELWNRIKQALDGPHFGIIHASNRAAIIDDVFNLARGGYVNYTTALSITNYLSKEKHYAPWRAALINFAFLEKRLVIDSRTQEMFQQYVESLIMPVYDLLGFDEQDNESYFKSLLRINILEWMCKYKNAMCVLKCNQLFNRWIHDPQTIIPVNIRSIVYCTAVSEVETNWLLLFHRYIEETYQDERDRMMKALTCTQNSKNLEQLLQYSITKNQMLKIQESLNIFSAVSSSSATGVRVTTFFMNKYYTEVFNYFGGYNALKSILTDLVVHITTPELVTEFRKMVQLIDEKFLPIKNTIFLCMNQIHQELMWHETYFLTISKFFENSNDIETTDENEFSNSLR